MAAQILSFISRLDLLKRRFARNFGTFMAKRGPYTHPDVAERACLEHEHEQEEEQRRDRVWAERHGPISGGAEVVAFVRRGLVVSEAPRSMREDTGGC